MVPKRYYTWVCPDISEIINIPKIINISTIPEITIII